MSANPVPPSTTVQVLSGRIERADIAPLCARARRLLERSDADLLVCDLAALAHPDAATVDALARLQLTARRLGRGVRLRHACAELRSLLVLMGLNEVLPTAPASGIEPRGQAEEREQAPGVEEEADPRDPPA